MKERINNYSLDEIQVGQTEEFTKTITKEMVKSFREISDDSNPLHIDEEYAKLNGFPHIVVYGMLSASFLSTLAGVYLPGKRSLIHNVKVNFHKPVFIGDQLNIIGKVHEKDERFKIIKLKITFLNQNKVRVLSGTMQIGLLN